MRRELLVASLVLSLAACSGTQSDAAGPTPAVLVGAIRPAQGSLPALVTAYGSVVPSVTGTLTFSEAQPGQIVRLMVASGSSVRAGQPLALFVTAPTSRSSYQQAVSALAAAQKQRVSTAQLLSQQLATTDQLTQADKAVSDARTALAALRAEGAGAPRHTIVAPFAGVVTTVAVAQGDRTAAGATILTLARTGGIVVRVGIDPSLRGSLAAGQPATLNRLSGGDVLTGRVVRVDGALNATTRLVDVDLTFPAGLLLLGEATQVAIETGRVSGWVVPHSAVVTTGQKPHVFQIAGGKAKAVPVTLRLSSDKIDVIDGKIELGRPLIVDGAFQVNDDDAVRQGK